MLSWRNHPRKVTIGGGLPGQHVTASQHVTDSESEEYSGEEYSEAAESEVRSGPGGVVISRAGASNRSANHPVRSVDERSHNATIATAPDPRSTTTPSRKGLPREAPRRRASGRAALAVGEAVIKCPSPPNVLKYTCDHSCY